MNRINVTTWSDVEVITKKMAELQMQLVKYASGGYQKNGVIGDLMVMVAAIELRDRLIQLIDRPKK